MCSVGGARESCDLHMCSVGGARESCDLHMCSMFQGAVLRFMRAIFNMEEVRYNTVASLADDILTLAQRTAHSIDST